MNVLRRAVLAWLPAWVASLFVACALGATLRSAWRGAEISERRERHAALAAADREASDAVRAELAARSGAAVARANAWCFDYLRATRNLPGGYGLSGALGEGVSWQARAAPRAGGGWHVAAEGRVSQSSAAHTVEADVVVSDADVVRAASDVLAEPEAHRELAIAALVRVPEPDARVALALAVAAQVEEERHEGELAQAGLDAVLSRLRSLPQRLLAAATSDLVRSLVASEPVRRAAARLVLDGLDPGWAGSAECRDAFPSFLAALDSDQVGVRVAAASLLGEVALVDTAAAVDGLRRRLREDQDHDMRHLAIRALGRSGSADALEPLAAAMLDPADAFAREAAGDALEALVGEAHPDPPASIVDALAAGLAPGPPGPPAWHGGPPGPASNLGTSTRCAKVLGLLGAGAIRAVPALREQYRRAWAAAGYSGSHPEAGLLRELGGALQRIPLVGPAPAGYEDVRVGQRYVFREVRTASRSAPALEATRTLEIVGLTAGGVVVRGLYSFDAWLPFEGRDDSYGALVPDRAVPRNAVPAAPQPSQPTLTVSGRTFPCRVYATSAGRLWLSPRFPFRVRLERPGYDEHGRDSDEQLVEIQEP